MKRSPKDRERRKYYWELAGMAGLMILFQTIFVILQICVIQGW